MTRVLAPKYPGEDDSVDFIMTEKECWIERRNIAIHIVDTGESLNVEFAVNGYEHHTLATAHASFYEADLIIKNELDK